MATGERIRYIRKLRGMTQKQLGTLIGFDEKNADVRIAQYESGTRTPKEKLLTDIATALNVSPRALDLPVIDSYVGLTHTLFALEDLYGIQIGEIDSEVCLRLDKSRGMTYLSIFDIFNAWQTEAKKLRGGEITKEEYDNWRYGYSEDAGEYTVMQVYEQTKEANEIKRKNGGHNDDN
ncbi:MAG: helix-turn-helix domain-containing protein [Clostridiales bacterium]|nr:helix-turn-helix domain-containing protein [Clostridiales bacterium]